MAHKLFPSQQDDETIYLVVREHWFVLFLQFLVWVFFAAALIVFNRFAQANLPNLYIGITGEVTLLFTQVYSLFLALSLFLIWVFYYLNVQIITNMRIVDVNQEGLFSHVVSELNVDKIEDVTSQVNGLFGTIFNYGNVIIQTAGKEEHFDFRNVPNPSAIERIVLDLYQNSSNIAKDIAQA
jgi:hypothetical protein